MVELFDWETQEADVNLSGSSMEPLPDLSGLEYEDGDPHELVAELYGVDPSNTLFIHGAQEGMFLTLLALRPKEITIPIPIYPPVHIQARILGIRVRFVENPFEADTKVVAMVNPNNPTGEYYDLSELAGDRIVIVDEIFKPFVDDRFEYIDNSVIIMSTSKYFSVIDKKVGWIIADKKYIDHIRDVRDLVSPPPISDVSLINYIIPNIDFFRKRNQAIIKRNLDLLTKKSGFFQIIYRKYMPVAVLYRDNLDDMMFARELHRRYDVLLTPTSFFLLPGGLRIGLGRDSDMDMMRALDALNKLCSDIGLSE